MSDGWRIWGGSELPEPEPFGPRDFRAAPAGLRNGLPEVRPYVWRPGDAEREAEVQARLAAFRAAREVARLRWKQALADEAAAKRMRRGQRPVPQVTGIRINPGRQP